MRERERGENIIKEHGMAGFSAEETMQSSKFKWGFEREASKAVHHPPLHLDAHLLERP